MSRLIAARNIAAVAWNRAAKLLRGYRRRLLRRMKGVRESAKHARAQVKRGRARGRDVMHKAYSGSVKTTRAWERWRERVWSAAAVDLSVKRELRRASQGGGPIIVGPWLGEVGYEALYWVPFVRWFADHYRVRPDRLVVVSRGGVAGWYGDIADTYVEILDLFTPEEFARANGARQDAGDQKQLVVGSFDAEIVARVRQQLGADGRVCHPSTMFRLMRRFWLGTDSLQCVLDHTLYRRLAPVPPAACPPLPESFVAVKFYTGRALPDTDKTRAALRNVLRRVRGGRPLVMLDTGLTLDEHHDYGLDDLGDVRTLAEWLTPQNNLAIQTEVIRRADLFVATCGSLAWLAPMLGTDTLAVYTDDHLLAPHLYAARQIYPAMGAASFTPIDLAAVQAL
jgi:hypothetical protein